MLDVQSKCLLLKGHKENRLEVERLSKVQFPK